MLACFLEAKGKTIVRNVPIPTLGKGEVLVRMGASGICGTDLEKIEGQLGPGGILGHEVSGTIESVANGVEDVNPGDRVVVHHHVPCYHCSDCSNGNFTMCQEFKQTNIDPCGFSEFFRVPRDNVVRGGILPISAGISFEEAAMIEPTACCIRAINKAIVKRTDNVLVVGLGPTGLTQIQLLRKATSGRIIGADILLPRLQIAGRLGADATVNPRDENVSDAVRKLTADGADLAIIATGNEKAFDSALASVRKGGQVLLFGAPAYGASYRLDVSSLFSCQLSIVSSYSCLESEMHEAMRLIAEKAVDVKSMITDRFKVEKADKAFEHARTSTTSIKTMVLS